MTAFLDPDIIWASDIYVKLINAVYDNIKRNAYSDNDGWYIYVPLENKIFHNSTTVNFLISLYKAKEYKTY